MIARVVAAVALVVVLAAGCTSTVLLGSLGPDGGNLVDLARPTSDLIDGGAVDLALDGGFDIGFGSDAAPLVDLAP